MQTATRAYYAGEDEEVVVASLLHDLGELTSPINHGEIAAAALRPVVSPTTAWTLAHHEMFQFYHYAHAYNISDADGPRRRYAGEPAYAAIIIQIQFQRSWTGVSGYRTSLTPFGKSAHTDSWAGNKLKACKTA